MTITAQIVADSISPTGQRITTMQLRYPRFIHAEELTHRILSTTPEQVFAEYLAIADGLMYDENLSRNASSSRAIPVKRLIKDIRRDPAMPIYWGRNQPGMQAGEDHFALVSVPTASGGIWDRSREEAWLDLMEIAIQYAEAYAESDYHKQIVNRILEPWAHINVVVTATNWNNFFSLRAHKDAQPEIRDLALKMIDAMANSLPVELQPGEWHLPYINATDFSQARLHQKKGRITRDEPMYDELVGKVLIPVSVARCARVSFLTHDGRQTTVEEDMALYEKLVGGVPLHASPAEHQGTPDMAYPNPHNDPMVSYENPDQHGNFTGWIQFRKLLEEKFDDRC